MHGGGLPSTTTHSSSLAWREIRQLLCLTISLAGLQFTWTVELGYGTPYLLSLGMSKSLTSLVWLAGPISGLVMQPLVGALSDRSTLRWGRRRPFMLVGSLCVVFALFLIGWAKELASPWSNQHMVAVWIAVIAFYVVDFAINTVQASIRALIVDVLPKELQERGNAWAGGMIGLGSVGGYFMGMIDLANYFSRLGDSQMKILCFLASFTLLLSISITCWTTSEKPFREQRKSSSSLLIEAKETIQHLMKTVRHLPIPIRRVCHTQFFAWIGWFPFLFYSTTWVAELAGHGDLATQQPGEDRVGDATRTGSFAFLLYSLVSLTTACILPILTQLHTGSNRFTHWLNLPNLYTFAHLLFGTTMLLTWWISRVDVATFAIAICGIAWAIMMWAPFALIGEMINSYPATTETYYDEEQINMTRLSSESTSEDLVVHDSTAPTHHIRDSAGEILGIHNVYIVLPQFISTIMSSVIFACVGQQETSPVAIGWVLRVGGLCVLIAAYMSTRIRRTYHII